ncbi:MAG TPA: ABC transporter permease [Jatrophihabitans sp.]|nr:ABC transporter permease [Jatrophihabitans sp.]
MRYVLVWELEKLLAQWRTRTAALLCLLGPAAFVIAVKLTGTVPADTLFGRWINDSGIATPLVVLGFAAAWGFPALIAVVAGDLFSAEDHYDTWKTILTRSQGRWSFFAGKVVAAFSYVIAIVVLLAASSIAAGLLLLGNRPLIGLSGNVIPIGSAIGRAALSWLSVLPSCLAFAAIAVLLSVLSRSSLTAIGSTVALGLTLQFAGLVDGINPVIRLLPGSGLLAWHGLFAQPAFTEPLWTGVAVAAAWVFGCLGLAWHSFSRRDIAGSSR